ncbi:hypothetical protein BDR07DRAFT_1483579 [Suillus spraguei]|nr:hypothetical protein BDR07DRAFT_1495027 [Suillus spraguei]KAG2363524.1 hypothetical protein BDR07DRAFT_1483643 [Suillus spraguei]KAG2363591.1 hypothetical protein BDR07DRAFT_1483579 [Suillus spraguei]
MRSSTPTQFQSSRALISGSTTQSNSAAFRTSIPEARQRPISNPAYEYGRPPVTSSYEYGRPPVTGSYAAPVPAFGSDSTTTTRHKNSWLDEARESTTNFKKNGSPVPLVWILIEDKTVPRTLSLLAKTAMDRRSSLHVLIWREVSVSLLTRIVGTPYINCSDLGKVGYHTSGALISYVGKEHLIEKYEVLVISGCNGKFNPGTVVLARQQQGKQELKRTTSSLWSRETQESTSILQTTTTLQTTLHVDDIPRFAPSLLIQEEELRRVAEYKTVILIDDSMSMAEGDSWNQVREALGGIVDLAYNMDPKGSISTSCTKLTDSDDLLRCIIEAASRLDKQTGSSQKFGIQFVQIGTDQDAAKALHMLDDELSERYKIRDIVDTTPFDPANGAFNTDYMIKILIGSLHKELDNGTAEMLSPEKKLQTSVMPGYDRHPSPVLRSASPIVSAGGLRARLGGIEGIG